MSMPVNFPSLTIPVNKPPIASIELCENLYRLKVTQSMEYSHKPEFYRERERIVDIVRSRPDFGNIASLEAVVEVFGCSNIEEELSRLKVAHPGIKTWAVDALKEQGLLHTIQVPINALHAAGYLDDAQKAEITLFVQKQCSQTAIR